MTCTILKSEMLSETPSEDGGHCDHKASSETNEIQFPTAHLLFFVYAHTIFMQISTTDQNSLTEEQSCVVPLNMYRMPVPRL